MAIFVSIKSRLLLLTLFIVVLFIAIAVYTNIPQRIEHGLSAQIAIKKLDKMRRPLIRIKNIENQLMSGTVTLDAVDKIKVVDSEARRTLTAFIKASQYNKALLTIVERFSKSYKKWITEELAIFQHSKDNVNYVHEHLINADRMLLGTLNILGNAEKPIHKDIRDGSLVRFYVQVTVAGFIFYLFLIILILQNISRRKLSEREKNLSTILHSIGDAVISTDIYGCIQQMNPVAEQLTGWLFKQARGKLLPEVFVVEHAVTGEVVTNPVDSVLKNGRITGLANHTVLTSRTGERYQIADSAAPIQSNTNEILGVVLVFHDVTENSRMQRDREDQASRLDQIIESSMDAIIAADENNIIVEWNRQAEKIFGWLREEAIGKTLYETIIPMQYREKQLNGINLFRQAGEKTLPGKRFEASALNKKGELFPIELSISKSDPRCGCIFVAYIRDLSEVKKAEQERIKLQAQIEHTQRLDSLGVLAGGIAHDFNNILTAILGNASMAEHKVLLHPQAAKKYLANIVSSSERAAELCKQMLAYSGKGKFVVKALDLSVMVEEITRLLEVSIASNVILKYHLIENLPAVEADAAQMQQVIMNLVMNASDAIDDNSGVISIATGLIKADTAYLASTCLDDDLSVGSYVYLEVSDTGCGMNKETQDRLFEPFFTTKFTGHGLGMSAVMGIVRGHHGAIKVYSESGRGTTFKVLLPVCNQPAQKTSSAMPDKDSWQGSGTVLVVDDEESIREIASVMLEDMGFSILTAVDGEDAVNIYRQHHNEIVAVLMDMTMPNMDGKTCFTELRRINTAVKVVLSSGYNEQEATSRFAGQGLAGFIQKPYLPETLQLKMQAILL